MSPQHPFQMLSQPMWSQLTPPWYPYLMIWMPTCMTLWRSWRPKNTRPQRRLQAIETAKNHTYMLWACHVDWYHQSKSCLGNLLHQRIWNTQETIVLDGNIQDKEESQLEKWGCPVGRVNFTKEDKWEMLWIVWNTLLLGETHGTVSVKCSKTRLNIAVVLGDPSNHLKLNSKLYILCSSKL